MTRERWEQILFAHVEDEVAQDTLNQYVLELESSNAKLRELAHDMWCDGMCDCDELVAPRGQYHCAQCQYHYRERMRDLGIEVD